MDIEYYKDQVATLRKALSDALYSTDFYVREDAEYVLKHTRRPDEPDLYEKYRAALDEIDTLKADIAALRRLDDEA